MRDRIYYKLPDGSIYSVSQRVIDSGIPPLEGAVDLPEDEKEAFIIRVQRDQELASRLSSEEHARGLKFLQPDSVRVHEKTVEILNSNISDEEKQELIKDIDGSIPQDEKEAYAQLLVDKKFPALDIKNITGIDVPDPEPEYAYDVSEPEPEVLSPIQQRRLARLQKREELRVAQIEKDHSYFFETLPEEEVPYYENLLNQGLTPAQLYNIKVAKDAKKIGGEV